MEPFATLDELLKRLDWTLDEDERRIAASALEDASDLARGYGRDWPADAAPRLVRTLVLRVCKRYMDNPDGYVSSRAGDETLTWTDRGRDSGSVHFTKDEIELLRDLAGNRRGVWSVPVTSWGPQAQPASGFVAVDGPAGQKPFPLYADGEPW